MGLGLAAFLFVAGLTGSVIAFHHELDRWLNPGVLSVASGPAAERASVSEWIEAAEWAHPKARVFFVTAPRAPGEPAVCFLAARQDPATQEAESIQEDQVFVHPATAEVLGSRDRDGFEWDRLHIISFIYTCHYSLQLGQWGIWIIGAAALIWFFDCFVGLYLAWPQKAWTAVKRALTIKWRANRARINYDMHRAGGLWAWLILLVLAFSGMSMNLHEEVFDPLMETVSPMTPWPGDEADTRQNAEGRMPVSVTEVVAASRKALQDHGMIGELGSVWLNYDKGLYHIGYHTEDDLTREHPGAWVSVDGTAGEIIDARPAGGHTMGDLIHDLQFPLHSGKIAGLPGRVIVSVAGLMTAMLSVTGGLIWWRKRRVRRRVPTAAEDTGMPNAVV